MKDFIEGKEESIVNYLRHVMKNGSFYPITTFFLISCAVLAALFAGAFDYLHAGVTLGFSGLVLLLIADRRDRRRDSASFEVQLEAVRKLVQESAQMSAAVATVRSDNQERSMHAQDRSIAVITDNTTKDLS